MNKNILSTFILLLACFTNPLHADEANISIDGAWIAEAPPVSKVMVAYLTINNDGDETVTINKAESDAYSKIEFHETIHENGMARMVSYDALKIPAHGHMRLERGAAHFMLFNPKRALKAGDKVSITLHTKSNTTKTFSVPVKKARY
jgi:copper(I)-binding protein